MTRRFALRVDVDTVSGLTEGIPPLLKLCADIGIKATFFICVGKDTAARAFLTAPRPRRHLAISPLTKYGPREILFSIPGRRFSARANELRLIQERGHEVQLHCYNHLDWIRRIDRATVQQAEAMISKGAECFKAVMGRRPDAFASPGFRVTEAVLDAEERIGFVYASDYHREGECLPFVTGNRSVVQIPVNAPLIEDLVASGESDETILKQLEETISNSMLTVLYIHAAYEPRLKMGLLASVLESASESARFVTLMEVRREWTH